MTGAWLRRRLVHVVFDDTRQTLCGYAIPEKPRWRLRTIERRSTVRCQDCRRRVVL